jgi:perosamine synthetase
LCFGHAVNRFNHIGIGHNFRLSNIQAALGCAQIPLVDSILERKREINRRYRSNLDGCSGLQWQGSYPDTISNSWANGFLLTNGIEASNVIVGLQANGVESRPFFYPMHKQKFVKDRCEYLSCQFSSHLAEYGMYLPSGVGTTDDEIDVACDTLCRILDT